MFCKLSVPDVTSLRLSLIDSNVNSRICIDSVVDRIRRIDFYPRDAMLARVIAIATCPSVCPSVCLSVCHEPVLCQNEES